MPSIVQIGGMRHLVEQSADEVKDLVKHRPTDSHGFIELTRPGVDGPTPIEVRREAVLAIEPLVETHHQGDTQ